MEEQLITLETARLAKEKKFNWNCVFYFFEDLEDSKVRECGDYRSGKADWNDFDIVEDCFYYSAPTQSLLQKWLREVHSIHIHFNTTTDSKWYIHIEKLEQGCGFMGGGGNSDYIYDSYEEALEYGILEALKSIE